MKNPGLIVLLLVCAFLGHPAQGQQGGIENLRQTGKAFAAVAREVSPSVVSVRIEKDSAGVSGDTLPFGEDMPFRDDLLKRFFGDLLPGMPETEAPRGRRRLVGQGSGFFFSVDDGLLADRAYILTNYHVVEDADSIQVSLQDGREFQARVKGADPQSDVAVLEIDTADVTPLPLGDSATLEVGEWVLAIGNPFGLQHTLTVGVVSAKGRTSLGISDYEDFIQTDASINPGNSGGPLVNLDGKVVGMSTAIFSRSGGYMGIGFAIPVNLAVNVANQLIEHGSVVRGYLGVVIQTLTPQLAGAFDLDNTQGVLVAQVGPDTPAAEAGLRQGDIIVAYRGKPVTEMGDFRNRVALTTPGSRVELAILRDGKRQTLHVEIGRLERDKLASLDTPQSAGQFGLTVQTLTPPLAEQFGVQPGEGVVVTAVERGSVADLAGIEVGSVILQVNQVAVNSAETFARAVAKSRADNQLLLLLKKGELQQYVILKQR
jgi:serine protease Do